MSMRRLDKLLLVPLGCLPVLLAVWILAFTEKEDDDERRFHQMLRAQNWGWRLLTTEKRLPGPLVRLFHIASFRRGCMYKAQAREEALFGSGYLTNTLVTITNLPASASSEKSLTAELVRRLRAGAHFDFLQFHVESNQVLVFCRSKDLALIRTAIQTP
jgi:hypothetical protein